MASQVQQQTLSTMTTSSVWGEEEEANGGAIEGASPEYVGDWRQLLTILAGGSLSA